MSATQRRQGQFKPPVLAPARSRIGSRRARTGTRLSAERRSTRPAGQADQHLQRQPGEIRARRHQAETGRAGPDDRRDAPPGARVQVVEELVQRRRLWFPLPVGVPYGSPTGCKPRVSLAAPDLATRTSRHRSWDHSNDRRTLVIHSLDDGRSSRAARRRTLTH